MWESTIQNDHSSESEELTQIFNSALISSRANTGTESPSNVLTLLQSPAFKEVLLAVKRLSSQERITLLESAESLVVTFRRLDRFWTDYLLKEGFERIKSQLKGPKT